MIELVLMALWVVVGLVVGVFIVVRTKEDDRFYGGLIILSSAILWPLVPFYYAVYMLGKNASRCFGR